MAEHAGGNNEHTRKIAEFVSGLSYDAIPAEVRERIKLLILDSLGCAIYGADLEWRAFEDGIVATFPPELGTGAWFFVEQPTGLPWRR